MAYGEGSQQIAPASGSAPSDGGDQIDIRIWLRLLTSANLIEKRVRAGLRQQFNTTLPRFDVLAQLARAPEGLTMGALSNRLMVSAGNLTGLVEYLDRSGYVARKPDPDDGRAQRVTLTKAGRAAFDNMLPAHRAWIADMMSGLTDAEKDQAIELLERLKASVAEADRRSSD